MIVDKVREKEEERRIVKVGELIKQGRSSKWEVEDRTRRLSPRELINISVSI